MASRSRTLILLVVLGITLFAGISIYSDLGTVGAKLADFHWFAFGLALLLALINYVLRFVRWSFYLRSADIKLSATRSALVFLSGFAFSITPGKLGELFKCYLIREYQGAPVARSAPLVVGERVTDLLALVALGTIGALAYGQARTMVVVAFAILAGGLLLLSSPSLVQALIEAMTRPLFVRRLRDPLLVFYAGLARLVRLRPLVWATGLATLAWLAECFGFALIVAGFPGAELSVSLAIFIYAVTTVAGALSFLPGGLLVTEATMLLLLVESAAGLEKSTAIAAIFLTRLATLWFAVLIGVVALVVLRHGSGQAARALARLRDDKSPGCESTGEVDS